MLARMENDIITEVLTPIDGFKVEQCFHKDLIAMCVEVPDHVKVGWSLVDGEWQAPVEEVIEELAVEEPVIEEPVTEETIAEEPVVEEPVTQA